MCPYLGQVEMFVLCTPEQSNALHEELRAIGQEMYTDLGLHFKVSSCTVEEGRNDREVHTDSKLCFEVAAAFVLECCKSNNTK